LPSDVNDDVFDVKNELITVAARWMDIGTALHLKSDTLDNIESRCGKVPHRCLDLMV